MHALLPMYLQLFHNSFSVYLYDNEGNTESLWGATVWNHALLSQPEELLCLLFLWKLAF